MVVLVYKITSLYLWILPFRTSTLPFPSYGSSFLPCLSSLTTTFIHTYKPQSTKGQNYLSFLKFFSLVFSDVGSVVLLCLSRVFRGIKPNLSWDKKELPDTCLSSVLSVRKRVSMYVSRRVWVSRSRRSGPNLLNKFGVDVVIFLRSQKFRR